MTFEVAWQEINAKGRIVTKRKCFDSEAKLNRFVEKLFQKDNFVQVLGYRL